MSHLPRREPTLVADLHLDAPLRPVSPDVGHRRCRLLVRLHGHPVGELFLPLGEAGLSRAVLAEIVWRQFSARIVEHLAGDELPQATGIPEDGLPASSVCWPAVDTRSVSVTVVIATRDRPDSLLRCLASLTELRYPKFDVVVVDSAPHTGETADRLTTHAWPFQLRYVRVPRPGLGLAHNAALPAVTGEIVVFTDDDVQVDRNWLMCLAAGFAEPDTACVTGLILPAELDTTAQLLLEQAGGFARGLQRRRFSLDQPPGDALFPFTAGRFGSGANMAFRTDWLRARGGFDPAAGAGTPARGGDDLIAFLAVVLDGRALVYEPAAIVRHWHRRDYAGLVRQSFGYGVGLGAYLTASVCSDRTILPAMMRRAVPAMRHLLGSTSEKNHARPADFPSGLVWRERAGVLVGPLAYAASRYRYRKVARNPAVGDGEARTTAHAGERPPAEIGDGLLPDAGAGWRSGPGRGTFSGRWKGVAR